MGVSRRTFFQSVMGVSGVTAAAVVAEAATTHSEDSFQYHGWHVRWVGWRQAYDSLDVIGIWLATRSDDQGELGRYATTLGGVRPFPWRVGHVFDCSRDWNWTDYYPTGADLSEIDKRTLKDRTRIELLSFLSNGA